MIRLFCKNENGQESAFNVIQMEDCYEDHILCYVETVGTDQYGYYQKQVHQMFLEHKFYDVRKIIKEGVELGFISLPDCCLLSNINPNVKDLIPKPVSEFTSAASALNAKQFK